MGRGSQDVEIGIDNQAAMDTLNFNEPAPGHYIVDKVWKLLKKIKLKYPATNLIVWWILGNVGLKGTNWQIPKPSRLWQAMPVHLIPSQHSYAAHSPSLHQQPGVPTMGSLKMQLQCTWPHPNATPTSDQLTLWPPHHASANSQQTYHAERQAY